MFKTYRVRECKNQAVALFQRVGEYESKSPPARRAPQPDVGHTQTRRGKTRADHAQPSTSNLALSAAYACDQVIVPIPVARKGLDALLGTHQVVRSLGRRIPGFEVLLYPLTQYQAGLRDAQERLEQIKAQLPHLAPVLSHRPGVYNGAHTEGMPIGVYRPHDEARREVQAVVRYLLERLGSTPSHQEPS